MSSKAAVIDVGTNSVRLLIAEINSATLNCQKQRLETTRLGEGIKESQGVLLPEAINRTFHVVSRYFQECVQEGVGTIKVLGTSVLREASNGNELIRKIRDELNLEVEILSEEQEAFLSYRGALKSLPEVESGGTFLDVGGGSTEVVWGQKELYFQSFPAGAVRLKELFEKNDPPSTGELESMEKHLYQTFPPDRGFWNSTSLIGTGGTITTLAAVKKGMSSYKPRLIHGEVLGRDEVEDMLQLFLNLSLEERKKIKGMSSERADIIIPGALIIKFWLENFWSRKLTVSEGDLMAGSLSDERRIII